VKKPARLLVRWVHNPASGHPLLPFEKRDLGPETTPNTAWLTSSISSIHAAPNDGHELQVQQPTVMPSLRLTWEEARDIASYLITLKRKDAPTNWPRPGRPETQGARPRAW